MTTFRKAFSHAVAMAVLAMSRSCGKPLNPDGPPFLHDRRDGCDKVSEKCDSVLGNFSLNVEYTDK